MLDNNYKLFGLSAVRQQPRHITRAWAPGHTTRILLVALYAQRLLLEMPLPAEGSDSMIEPSELIDLSTQET